MIRRIAALVLLAAGICFAAVPSFESVPDHWKQPYGPYRQAPAECGGKWYAVSPFNQAPWRVECKAGPAQDKLPAGFVEIFGNRPDPNDFRDTPNPSVYYQVAVTSWEQDLRYFVRAGAPDWLDAATRENIHNTAVAWGMGTPGYYEGRYGCIVRFASSAVSDFELPCFTVAFSLHNGIASYQLRLIDRGTPPERCHPYVPPDLCKKN